jgi:L-aspartate oxidase
MALRAGVAVADLEFFQFHPTALALPGIPRPLLSEALRGHGALLRDRDGERFVDELLPRDVVSRAVLAKMLEQGTDHVWLDATVLEDFADRFPTINADLVRAGLDPRTDLLPVAPAAHHQCGGIVTDLRGATTLPGLWAAGETACSGVHGANRLASNSLLEGMVFGPRAVEAIAEGIGGPEPSGVMRPLMGVTDRIGAQPTVETVVVPTQVTSDVDAAAVRLELQRAMFKLAGVQRTADGLEECAAVLDSAMAVAGAVSAKDPALAEVANLALVGRTLVAAAVERTESRGTHSRLDHPETDPDMAYRRMSRATLVT